MEERERVSQAFMYSTCSRYSISLLFCLLCHAHFPRKKVKLSIFCYVTMISLLCCTSCTTVVLVPKPQCCYTQQNGIALRVDTVAKNEDENFTYCT